MPSDNQPLGQTMLMVSFSAPILEELERLLQTGLYGFNREEVVERIVCRYLEDRLNARLQKREPFP